MNTAATNGHAGVQTFDTQSDEAEAVGQILNNLLADEFVLYTKTLKFHWNVVGPFFLPLREQFQLQSKQLEEIIDKVAERTRMVGATTYGTLAEFAQHTQLQEFPGKLPDARAMITNLLADHETIINQLREDLHASSHDYGDPATSNFLTGLLEKHEQTVWMLRSMLAD